MRIAVVFAVIAATTAGVAHVRPARPVPTQAKQQSQPTSYELIDDALAKGTIDAESAHKFRVFAGFGDPRLPAAYKGDDSRISAMPPSVMRVGRFLKTFSAQTRAELEPFFKRPDEPGSWYELATIRSGKDETTSEGGPSEESSDLIHSESQSTPNWDNIPAANGLVTVWVDVQGPRDLVKAHQIATAITNLIWPKLTRLFWGPVNDARLGPGFYVYLLAEDAPVRPVAWSGVSMPLDPANECVNSPRYIVLDNRYPVGGPRTQGMVQGIANLLTESIVLGRHLLGGQCDKYDWIRDATNKWAEHFVYPDAQSEQRYAVDFLEHPEKSLDAISGSRSVGAYLFPFYLQLQRAELAMPAMWLQFELKEPLDGIDAGLRSAGKKLEDVFPEFAADNWNRGFVGDYWPIDKLAHSAKNADSIVVTLPSTGTYEKKLALGMPYLSAMNYYFTFDPTVQTVTFENTLRPVTHARVWAIEKLKGTWQQPYDFSPKDGKTWCRAAPGQELDELVLVFTNVQWQKPNLTVDPGPDQPVLSALNTGCGGWVGKDSVTNRVTETELTIIETAVSELEFEVDSALVEPGRPLEYWKSKSGTISWKVTATGRRCGGSGAGTVTVQPSRDDHAAVLNIWNDGGKMRVSGTQGPWPGVDPTYTIRCSDGTTFEQHLGVSLGFFQTDPDRNELAADGKSFSGNFLTNPATPAKSAHHIYSFHCVSGC